MAQVTQTTTLKDRTRAAAVAQTCRTGLKHIRAMETPRVTARVADLDRATPITTPRVPVSRVMDRLSTATLACPIGHTPIKVTAMHRDMARPEGLDRAIPITTPRVPVSKTMVRASTGTQVFQAGLRHIKVMETPRVMVRVADLDRATQTTTRRGSRAMVRGSKATARAGAALACHLGPTHIRAMATRRVMVRAEVLDLAAPITTLKGTVARSMAPALVAAVTIVHPATAQATQTTIPTPQDLAQDRVVPEKHGTPKRCPVKYCICCH